MPISQKLGLRKVCAESFTFPTTSTYPSPNQTIFIPTGFRGKTICIKDNGLLGTLVTTPFDKVLATNPTYTFAYPLNGGEFPTRATAIDILQVAYDALGTLWTQGPRDRLASPLLPGVGLADLSTQAPKVNFFGLQTGAGSPVGGLVHDPVNPLLRMLQLGGLETRTHSPL